MRLKAYLRSIHALATAESLYSPAVGTLEDDEPVNRLSGLFELYDFHERIAVVTNARIPIGIVSCGNWFGSLLEHDTDNQKVGELSESFSGDCVIPLEATFLQILATAESLQSKTLLVGDKHRILGSVCVEDMLKPPGLIYLLCLSLDLESATVELCSLFPRSFELLKKDRRDMARDVCKARKQERLRELLDQANGMKPHRENVVYRELIQTTMMCDKLTMLTQSDDLLGLRVSKKQIKRVFRFCERIRNYAVHPSASFTRDCYEAERLASADHEPIENDDTWSTPHSRPVRLEVLLDSLCDLARAIHECNEVISDIDRALA